MDGAVLFGAAALSGLAALWTRRNLREPRAGGIDAADRAAGAIVGTLIGDALGVGPHWYYDLDVLRKEFGRITDYTAPKKGRYHEGVKPGEGSQEGQFTLMLLESVAECGGYDARDYTRRIDELLATLDGTAYSGRYTNQAIRDVWAARKEGKPWGDCGSFADTSEGAIRSIVVAMRYCHDTMKMGTTAADNIKLTHVDPAIYAAATSFAVVVGFIVRGVPFTSEIGWQLREAVGRKELPFTHAVLAEERDGEHPVDLPPPTKDLPFPDALLQPQWAVAVANNPAVRIPDDNVAQVWGMACSQAFLLPAAYYLAAKHRHSFEDAVLAAINSGGNNMARAAMTGAVAGAMNGLSGIPERLIKGLKDHERIVKLAKEVAAAGTAGL